MPLEFRSQSHGPIAFGFFNIESDMLLLEHYFFFAPEFCRQVAALATPEPEGLAQGTHWCVYVIEDRRMIGDLMGAIYGVAFQGFIGELYKLFPFPKRTEEFKQKPEGFMTRAVVEKVIQGYAQVAEIPLVVNREMQIVTIGDYVFTGEWFQELIKYVWRGGYPRWKDEVRPEYVIAMKKALEGITLFPFQGLTFP
jgi:hypothetical protein